LKATAGAYSVRPDHLKEKKKRGLIRHYQPRPNLVSDLVSKPAILPVFSDSVDFLTFCRQQLTLFVVPWHGRGRRFDPDQVHQFSSTYRYLQFVSPLPDQILELAVQPDSWGDQRTSGR
jgi:hypothetical protein